MNNGLIHFLERNVGFLLCVFLDFHRFIFSIFSSLEVYPRSKKIVFVKFIEQGALVLHIPL